MFFVSMYLNNASLSEIRIFCIYFNGVKIGRVWSKGCTFFNLKVRVLSPYQFFWAECDEVTYYENK